MSSILDIQDLQISFTNDAKEMVAVHNSSFAIEKGEIVAIVGESGSGKSVSSLAMMGLLATNARTNGKILFHNGDSTVDLLALTPTEIKSFRGKKIAMIFQEPMSSLNPVMRCGKQMLESLQLHHNSSKKEAKAAALRLFDQVKLPDPERIFQSFPHQLSGGQRQRVMIAMALASTPEVLIADEPTTALDVTVQKEILSLLKELQQQTGMSILFITHDLGVVANLADRVIVMHKGHIVETGEVKTLFSTPKHPYTKGLLASRPPLEKRYKKLASVSDFIEKDSLGNWVEKNIDQSFTMQLEWKEQDYLSYRKKIYEQSPILQVQQLSTHFTSGGGFFEKKKVVKAVDEVSFDLYPGETLGLVGESGCGKSTLGRSILKLIQSQSGNIIYQGKNIAGISETEMKPLRSALQIIFQDPYASLNPRMTVGQILLEVMDTHQILASKKQRIEKAYDLLLQVGLEKRHFDHFPHEFSGGQRQRIGIARAIATQPKVIICDESVSALDVSVQAQVLNLLNDLKEQYQLSYIFISHDMSVVKFMSDRIIVMNKGKIEEEGSPAKIFDQPSSAYTKKLIDAIPKGNE